MKKCCTFWVDIYVGLKEGYEGIIHKTSEVFQLCQEYCDKVGLGLTVTETEFIYTGGREPGVIIGLINYPRFEKEDEEIMKHGFAIGNRFLEKFKQERISIVTPTKTYMLERDDK